MFGTTEVVSREVLIRFNHSTRLWGVDVKAAEARSITEITRAADISQVEPVGGVGVYLLRSRTVAVPDLIDQLAIRSDVAYVEPNFVIQIDKTPNDPSFGLLYGLQKISAPSAWDISTGSAGITTAVIDTGIDYTHPDLAANVWSAPTAFTVKIGGMTITCAAGTHGFNAITKSCDPFDDNDHGTHVAGTIGAVGNNGLGVVGVNWNTSIMAAKFLDATGHGTIANAIDAIEFTIQAKLTVPNANVRVLSNSWSGGGFSQALLDEISSANANDMLFVAAAGNFSSNNDSVPRYPASYNAPNILAVAATDSNDNLATFSDYGSQSVHLGAPGVDIFSLKPGASYQYLSGTSMATPHVSGAAALILSVCNVNTAALKGTILNNVDPVPALAGITTTGGRLNVNQAIQSCDRDFTLTAASSQGHQHRGDGVFTVTVTALNGFNGTVALSCGDYPWCSIDPSAIVGSGTATLTVAPELDGTTEVNVTGTSGGITHTATVDVFVPCKPRRCM